mmetsp:Transcript_14895/g.14481  ORF Transcript_14895/g.14481 Transcript_14895/m.14481 type:complete len:80 (+) Transcript_14895:989-1228(+)
MSLKLSLELQYFDGSDHHWHRPFVRSKDVGSTSALFSHESDKFALKIYGLVQIFEKDSLNELRFGVQGDFQLLIFYIII